MLSLVFVCVEHLMVFPGWYNRFCKVTISAVLHPNESHFAHSSHSGLRSHSQNREMKSETRSQMCSQASSPLGPPLVPRWNARRCLRAVLWKPAARVSLMFALKYVMERFSTTAGILRCPRDIPACTMLVDCWEWNKEKNAATKMHESEI